MNVRSDWADLDVEQVARAIASRTFTAVRYAEALLERHERLRGLNAASWMDPERALDEARACDEVVARGVTLGPLAGVPMFVKDCISTMGYPTSAGTPALKRYRPQGDAAVVSLLKRAGAYVLGKANMHEMAVGGTSANPEFGFVRNPFDRRLIAGGSSGGSAVAVAAGLAPFALGTDTVGSVRIPASYCGVAGFRPTNGPEARRYSNSGMVPCASSFDTAGAIARTVAEVRLVHQVLSGGTSFREVPLRAIRIGVPKRYYWDALEPSVAHVARSALDRMSERATFVDIDIGDIVSEASKLLMPLVAADMSRDIPAFLASECPDVSPADLVEQMKDPEAKGIMRACLGADPTSPEIAAARIQRAALIKAYRQAFRHHQISAIVYPTVRFPPFSLPDAGEHVDMAVTQTRSWSLTLNTSIASFMGAPSLSIPAGVVEERLPMGLCLDGLPGDDDLVLALGGELEKHLGPLKRPLIQA